MNKKQDLVKKKIILKTILTFLILLIVAIEKTKINKILNILIQTLKDFKINNICKIIESKIY